MEKRRDGVREGEKVKERERERENESEGQEEGEREGGRKVDVLEAETKAKWKECEKSRDTRRERE